MNSLSNDDEKEIFVANCQVEHINRYKWGHMTFSVAAKLNLENYDELRPQAISQH